MTHPKLERSTRTRRRLWLLALALAVVFATGAFAWQQIIHPEDPLGAYQLADVKRADVEDVVTATGTLQPRTYVDIGAQVSGLLQHIHVEVGDIVEQGQLLAEIDPRLQKSRLDATRAQLRNQQAQLKEREANLILAQSQYRRENNLMAADATSEEALQNARAALRAAEAQIEALKAQIEQTESNLREDETNLEYTRIHAPMDGTVVTIEARQGQTLNANQQAPTILRIADLSTMTVQTQVAEADIGRLQRGMPAYFTTLGGNGQRRHGALQRIEPTPEVENNVVLYNALFDAPNPDGRLMSQMTAQVFFVLARAEDVLVVPMAALSGLEPAAPRANAGNGITPPVADTLDHTMPRNARVEVINSAGQRETRQVQVGVTSRVSAEIVEGLAAGEQVITGNQFGGAGNSGSARPMRMR